MMSAAILILSISGFLALIFKTNVPLTFFPSSILTIFSFNSMLDCITCSTIFTMRLASTIINYCAYLKEHYHFARALYVEGKDTVFARPADVPRIPELTKLPDHTIVYPATVKEQQSTKSNKRSNNQCTRARSTLDRVEEIRLYSTSGGR